jgi:predicted HTH transcriptional regulator
MQNNNRNNSSPFRKIFTLLGFLLGIVLYIIIKQEKEQTPKEDKKEKEIMSKREALPKKVNKKEVDAEVESIKLSERQEKIVKKLIEKGKMYPSELQDLLSDVSPRTVRRDMNSLEKKGLVEQKGTTKSTYYVYIGS